MKWCIFLFLAASQICQADLVRFEKENFQIDIPTSWTKVEEEAKGVLAIYRSADQAKGATVITAPFSAEEEPSALQVMVSAARNQAKESNVPVSGVHTRVIDGVTFDIHSMVLPNKVSVISAMAVSGLRGYSVQGFSSVSDAATDPEIIAILESFRLLERPAAMAEPPPQEKSAAYKIGRLTGSVVTFVFFGGLIIILIQKSNQAAKKRRAALDQGSP